MSSVLSSLPPKGGAPIRRPVWRLQFALGFETFDSLNCWQSKFVIEVEQKERRVIPKTIYVIVFSIRRYLYLRNCY